MIWCDVVYGAIKSMLCWCVCVLVISLATDLGDSDSDNSGVTTINYDPHHHHDRHHYYHYHYHPNPSSFTPSTLLLTSRVFRPGTNGAFTPWSEPSECTRSCGGGVELETRTCTNPKPSLNGADCDGVFTQLAPPKQWCNIEVRKE